MIDIEDNVPIPEDAWAGVPTELPTRKGVIIESNPAADNWVKDAFLAGIEAKTEARFNPPQPSATDCTFIGGPLNGQFGPVKGNAKVVEIEMYGPNGEVTSVELYALGDMHPTPTFRYHVGSKPQ